MVQISQLTDITIRNLKHGEYWDQKLPSFGVRVGKRFTTFLLKKSGRRVKLGHYPSISLQDARRRVFALKADPETIAIHMTLRDARALFLDTHCNHYRPKVLKETKRYLAKYDIYQDIKLSKLTTHAVLNIIDAQTRAEGNKLFTVSRTFFRFLTKRRLLHRSPLEGLPIPNKENKRTRVLTDHELKLIWQACEQPGECNQSLIPTVNCKDAAESGALHRLPANFATIVKLLILTGMRRTECASIQTSWITSSKASEFSSLVDVSMLSSSVENNLCLTIPASVTKNSREHTFPLCATALCVLSHTKNANGLLFPARGTGTKPFSGWSKSKKLLDKASGVSGWTLHTIRHTFRTIHARIGTMPHIAERLVNHISSRSDVEQIYDHWQYLEPMRDAMKRYETTLRGIMDLNEP